jgi:hypothetical protein
MGRDLFTILSSMDKPIENYTKDELKEIFATDNIVDVIEYILSGSFENELILEIKEDLDSKT